MSYRTGLIVGKFAPLTRGHESLIRAAARQCEELIILSYTSADYGKYSNPSIRRKALEMFVESLKSDSLTKFRVEVLERSFENRLWLHPDDDDAEVIHRDFCSSYLLNKLGTTVQAVFSSEEYGEGFAKHLQNYFNMQLGTNMVVDNVVLDLERKVVPISATEVRKMGAYKAKMELWISPDVYSLLVPKVLILGGESSGKTTLSRALADVLDTTWVPEYGRELWEVRGGQLFYEDMEMIAKTQLLDELRYGFEAKEFLICDTSPATTLFYSQKLFNRSSVNLVKMAYEANYDLILMCGNDIPFVQDGTRRDEAFRNEAYDFYLKWYARSNSIYVLHGSVEERVRQAMVHIGGLQ